MDVWAIILKSITTKSTRELIDVGTEGMRKAAMKYDFNADVKFLSYAVWWMRQAMIQAIEEKK